MLFVFKSLGTMPPEHRGSDDFAICEAGNCREAAEKIGKYYALDRHIRKGTDFTIEPVRFLSDGVALLSDY